MRYARTPSEPLMKALDGLLLPLRQPWTVAGLPLDLQLRERDEVMLYCGLTRLVVAQCRPPFVTLTAHKTYKSQPCAKALLRPWRLDEQGLGAALADYLGNVVVSRSHTAKEGKVQAAWMTVADPWQSLDREAVIGGGTSPFAAVDRATDAVRKLGSGWAKLDGPKAGNELDQLAIDPAGRLVLVELKHGQASKLYQAPLQALRYAWEWAGAVQTLLPELEELIEAKQRLGLLPANLPKLNGELRVAVAWGEEQPSPRVLRRLDLVVDALKKHLPPGLGEIEVWKRDGLTGRCSRRVMGAWLP